ncbi:MAG: hypothetical protein KC419_08775, partial [Anaerolineales bacterium]|nr:hypothetical protein [Anaerolineales bacterium]
QVTRGGSITNHTQSPRENLAAELMAELSGKVPPDLLAAIVQVALPDESVDKLETRRWYPSLPENPVPWPPQGPTNPEEWAQVIDYITNLGQMARPMSLGIGWGLGPSSLGFSVSGSIQMGGGVTYSTVEGTQGSTVVNESRTVMANHQQESTAHQEATTDESASLVDERTITRTDESPDARRRGVNIQYGGRPEDLILVAIPTNLLLRYRPPQPHSGIKPLSDRLRVRIDHLPAGLKLDVEFRGTVFPRERGSDV